MAQANADRNLLFGIMAFQMDFVGRDALLAGMQAWVFDKVRPLGQILQDQGVLTADRYALLEALVNEHLRMHGADVERSLASLGSAGPVRLQLEQFGDPELQASLARLPQDGSTEEDLYATKSASVGQPTSTGLRFRILRPHRKGGLGEVHVAHDEELRREVALKQIQEKHADDADSRSRFVLEAEITGRLEHPGIVPVYGLGQYADGRPFYAMRLIKGESFKDAIEKFHKAQSSNAGERVLELRKLLARFIAVCNAIAYAHSRGILHRDLKPSNIMLGQYGETLVVDWGLAKPLGRRTEEEGPQEGTLRPTTSIEVTPTQTGAVLGTPPYMSPEQACGQLSNLGPESDVYSLGATLYCLLTGRAPFEGGDAVDVLERVQKGDCPPPRALNRSVPAPLEAICRKAMALQPAARYATARALADDLEHWLADEPVLAFPESWSGRWGRWARRHRTLTRAGVATLVLGSFISVAAALIINDARREAQRLSDDLGREEKQTRQALKDSETNRTKADRLAASLALEQGLALCERGDPARGLLWFARSLELLPAGAMDLERLIRFNLDSWTREICAQKAFLDYPDLPAKGEGSLGQIEESSFSPDGRLMITTDAAKITHLWDVASGKLRDPVLPGSKLRRSKPEKSDPPEDSADAARLKPHFCAGGFRPDGAGMLICRDGDQLQAYDVHTGKTLGPSFEVKGDGEIHLSPDLRVVVYVPPLETPDAQPPRKLPPPPLTQTEKERLPPPPAPPKNAGPSLWETTTGRPIFQSLDVQGVSFVGFSQDGQILITHSVQPNAEAVKLSGMLGLLSSGAGPELLLAYCARVLSSGSHLFSNGVRLWSTRNGKPLWPLTSGPVAFMDVSISKDSRIALTRTGSETALLWDTATGRQIGLPLEHPDYVTGVALSPDGRIAATGSADLTARLWDAQTGKPLTAPLSLERAGRGITFVDLSHDGRLLITAWGTDLQVGQKLSVQIWQVATGVPLGPKHDLLVQETIEDVVGDVSREEGFDGRSFFLPRDRRIELWDLLTGKLRSALFHDSKVLHFNLSPDRRTLLTCAFDASPRPATRLWSVPAHAGPGYSLATNEPFDFAIFSQNGKRIVTSKPLRTPLQLQLWEADRGTPIGPVLGSPLPGTEGKSPDSPPVRPTEQGPADLLPKSPWGGPYYRFSPDGRYLIVMPVPNLCLLYDVHTGRLMGTPIRHPHDIFAVRFSPDGKYVLTAGKDETARLWDAATGDPVGQAMRHEGAVTAVDFSPDGRSVVTGGRDKMVRIWEVPSGKPTGIVMQHPESIDDVGFLLDGKRILAVGETRIELWEAASGRRIETSMSIAPESSVMRDARHTWLATITKEGKIVLWDTATGQQLGPPLVEQYLYSARSTKNGAILFTWGQRRETSQLWATATAKSIGRPLPTPDITDALFATGDEILVTLDAKKARLWHATTGQLIGPPLDHSQPLSATGVSSDGKSLLTLCKDGSITIWHLPAPLEGSPRQILMWVEVLTGLELDEGGMDHVLSADAWKDRQRRLQELGGPPRP
jgi:WD40 repeat protein/serine/threonine protein kinase